MIQNSLPDLCCVHASTYVCSVHVWRPWTRRPDKNRTKCVLFLARTLLGHTESGNLGLMFMQNEKEWKQAGDEHTWWWNMFAQCVLGRFVLCTYTRNRHSGVRRTAGEDTCLHFLVAFASDSKMSNMYSFCDRFPCHWMHPISICIHEFVSHLVVPVEQECWRKWHRRFVLCLSHSILGHILRCVRRTFYLLPINHWPPFVRRSRYAAVYIMCVCVRRLCRLCRLFRMRAAAMPNIQSKSSHIISETSFVILWQSVVFISVSPGIVSARNDPCGRKSKRRQIVANFVSRKSSNDTSKSMHKNSMVEWTPYTEQWSMPPPHVHIIQVQAMGSYIHRRILCERCVCVCSHQAAVG